MAQAVVFPGSVSATSYTMTNLDNLDASFTPAGNLNYYNVEHDRTGSSTLVNLTYYIQITTNINSLISHHAGGTIKAVDGSTVQDDVWSFAGATFSNSSGADVSYNLPTISSVSVELKDYKAFFMSDNSANVGIEWKYKADSTYNVNTDNSGATNGGAGIHVFDLDTVFSSNTDGVITAITSFSDISAGFQVRVPENIAFAQVLSLDFAEYASRSTVDPSDSTADVIEQIEVTADLLNGNATISNKLTAVNSLYNNQNILASWTVTFDAQDASGRAVNSYNTITNYARQASENWTTSAYGFEAGERIVTNGKTDFKLEITDGKGSTQTLIPSGSDTGATVPIYGVLRQSA